uniref:HDC17619 n=1 Tax=Drosophila melanogaster TaxID=7227 RepID=Q6IIM4_DROME|nr:TPA_inf: HDC17619 [Drosophila melanogaster]
MSSLQGDDEARGTQMAAKSINGRRGTGGSMSPSPRPSPSPVPDPLHSIPRRRRKRSEPRPVWPLHQGSKESSEPVSQRAPPGQPPQLENRRLQVEEEEELAGGTPTFVADKFHLSFASCTYR